MVHLHGRAVVSELLSSSGLPWLSVWLFTTGSFNLVAKESVQCLVNHAHCAAELGNWIFDRGIGKGNQVEDFSGLVTPGLRSKLNIAMPAADYNYP